MGEREERAVGERLVGERGERESVRAKNQIAPPVINSSTKKERKEEKEREKRILDIQREIE